MSSQADASQLLAVQPIYDRNKTVSGIELLYRDAGKTALDVGDEYATSDVLFNFCSGVSAQAERFKRPAFINVTADFLKSGAFLPIEPESVVVELVERIEPDRELIESVRHWHREGFRFALDDFEFKPSWDPLLELASVIKVDISEIGFDDTRRYREQLDRYSFQWLAERVETESQFWQYRDLGFDLFQGYFLARPEVIEGDRLKPASIQLGRLIEALFRTEPEFEDVKQLLSEDPYVAVNLLRIVNSPMYRGRYTIETMHDVILRLGITAIRRWVLVLATLNSVSIEAARPVLVRAFACAELARRRTGVNVDPDKAFLAGLLSGADVIMGVERERLLEEMPLSEAVKDAITDLRGDLGQILGMILQTEHAIAQKSGLDRFDERLLVLYRRCFSDVQELYNTIG